MKSAGRLAKSDFEALSEFRYQLRRFLRFSEQAAEEEGLTPLQYQLMLHIKGFPGRQSATVGELAERLQAHHHGVVALVTRCEQAGLVTRSPCETDRRQVNVSLTPLGEQRLQHLAKRHHTELKSLTNVFKVANISAFNDRD
ncbi:MAG TPA: MarR family transcriptional regulator [Burkholderiaceae bacterium]|jgi:DNA-binding MarR family transcriptional regulator